MNTPKINVLLCYQEPTTSAKQRKFITYCPTVYSTQEAQAFVENRLSSLNRDGYVSSLMLDVVFTLLTSDMYRVFLYPVDDTKGKCISPTLSSVTASDLDDSLDDEGDAEYIIENFVYDTLLDTSWVAGFYSDYFNTSGKARKDISTRGRQQDIGLGFRYMFPADQTNYDKLQAFVRNRGLDKPKLDLSTLPDHRVEAGTLTANSNMKASLVLPDEGYEAASNQAESMLTAYLNKEVEKCKQEITWSKVALFNIDRTEVYSPLRRTFYKVIVRYEHLNELMDLGFTFDFASEELEFTSNSNFLVRALDKEFAELINTIKKLDERDNQ